MTKATSLSSDQIERIRETVEATTTDWLTDYGIPRDESHGQLENRVVAAIAAMVTVHTPTSSEGAG